MHFHRVADIGNEADFRPPRDARPRHRNDEGRALGREAAFFGTLCG